MGAAHDISKWFNSCLSTEILILTKDGVGTVYHYYLPCLQAI
jgi:hypothetical protein